MAASVLGCFAGVVSTNYAITIQCPAWLIEPDLPCITSDPDLFFPDDYGMKNNKQIEEAKQACFACPAYTVCLEWAVPKPDLDGIWAATTPLDRRRLRTRMAA